jgi:hypothetical protein
MAMGRIMAIGSLFAAVTLALLAIGPSASAAKHEQVVFSGEGEGSLGEVEFWIWCAVDESGNYDDCNGAMAFDDLHLVRHVEGEVAEIGDDVYQMDVASTRDGTVACTLTNVPPILHGHANEVDIACSAPSGTATSTDAVVVATG